MEHDGLAVIGKVRPDTILVALCARGVQADPGRGLSYEGAGKENYDVGCDEGTHGRLLEQGN
jgi:hypothetical protein